MDERVREKKRERGGRGEGEGREREGREEGGRKEEGGERGRGRERGRGGERKRMLLKMTVEIYSLLASIQVSIQVSIQGSLLVSIPVSPPHITSPLLTHTHTPPSHTFKWLHAAISLKVKSTVLAQDGFFDSTMVPVGGFCEEIKDEGMKR